MIIIKKIPGLNCETKSNKKNLFKDTKKDIFKIEKRFTTRFEQIEKYGTCEDIEAYIKQLEKVNRYIKKKKNEIIKAAKY